MGALTGRGAVQMLIRLPEELREAIRADAAQNDRSLASEIYHRLKAKGPAEGATSPSHGPHDPHQETAMDTQKHNSESASAAMPDFRKAFEGLEEKINRVVQFSKVVDFLATEDVFDKVHSDGWRHFQVEERVGEIVRFLAEETRLAAEDVEAAWVSTHNAACRAEHAAIMAGAR